jgi:hypothetical protein
VAEETGTRSKQTDAEGELISSELRVVYTAEDGHLYMAEGDGRRTTRLTWAGEDFAQSGLPPMPGVTGDLEDGNIFTHPTPSRDGLRVAAFGLLPTLEEELWRGEVASGWELIDESFFLDGEDEDWSEEEWLDEDEEEEPLEDDIAGVGMVIALVDEDDEEAGEELLGGDGSFDAELEEAVVAALDGELDEDDEDDDELDPDAVPRFWPGGRVYVMHRDGIRVWEPYELELGSPTHLEWAPDDRHLVVLFQDEGGLQLELVDGVDPGPTRTIATGAPLFWSWQPRGARMALRLGRPEDETPILALADPLTDPDGLPREVAEAGSFYVPAWHPDGQSLVFSTPGSRDDQLLRVDADGRGRQRLHAYPGRGAFRWDGAGRRVALGVAPGGEGAFELLELIDVRTGGVQTLFQGSFVAFQWLPGDREILLASMNDDGTLLRWLLLEPGGALREVGVPWSPCRESAVALHFFEQVAASHPFVSADGRFVVHTGHPVGAVLFGGPDDPELFEGDEEQPAHVLVTPLAPGGSTVVVGTGRFGCFLG